MKTYLILIAVAVLSMVAAFEAGVHVERSKNEAVLSQQAAAAAKELADSQEQVRAAEAKSASDVAAVDQAYTEKLNDQKKQMQGTIDALKRGALRVRPSLTCAASVPSTAASGDSASGVDATSSGGLQVQDVEFLLRESGRADDYANQVNALQVIVTRDREVCSGQ